MDMMEIGEKDPVIMLLILFTEVVWFTTGNGALTIQEQRTHFAAWAFLKSPILL